MKEDIIYNDELFDIVFDDSGNIKMANNDDADNGYYCMARFDLTSNDNWKLDKTVGVHWLSNENDGFMQLDNQMYDMMMSISNKVSEFSYCSELTNLAIEEDFVTRTAKLIIAFTAYNNQEVKVVIE